MLYAVPDAVAQPVEVFKVPPVFGFIRPNPIGLETEIDETVAEKVFLAKNSDIIKKIIINVLQKFLLMAFSGTKISF